MEKEIEVLRRVLIEGRPIVFLGAGFSRGAKNDFSNSIELGKGLTKIIIDDLLKYDVDHPYYKEVSGYSLQQISQHAEKRKLKQELNELLKMIYSNIEPATFHYKFLRYPWRKIYTTNIDDLLENVCKKSNVDIFVQNSKKEKMKSGNQMEYIKLHGCVNNAGEGFTFSRGAYVQSISSGFDYRINSFTMDVQKEDFIFIGTNFDEIDIDYYLNLYRNAGYSSGKGKLIFINPSPSLHLLDTIEELNGVVIKWDTQQFLDFIDELNYNPKQLEKIKKQLNYEGFYNLEDIRQAYKTENQYDSKLYEGFAPRWEDIFSEWDFINPICTQIIEDITTLNGLKSEKTVHCISFSGKSYIGKSCILKRVAIELNKRQFDVIYFNGKELNNKLLLDYINLSNGKKYALLFDDASSYYPIIERLLKTKLDSKQLFIVVASRSYYHNKKRYYLDGNSHKSYDLSERINSKFASSIYNKLEEKGYLGRLIKVPTREGRIKYFVRQHDLMTCMLDLSSGTAFKKNINADVKNAFHNKDEGASLLLNLAIFDKMDVQYFPKELIPIIYNKSYDELVYSECVINLVKETEEGLAIRNNFYTEEIIKIHEPENKIEALANILMFISPQVSESKLNYWKIMFESLTKEDLLRKQLELNTDSIRKLFYKIKNYYSDISYYWLQLGLIEQVSGEFERALNHLEQAESIKPIAYQIQHAIGRNYLKYANSLGSLDLAESIFKKGEEKLLKLIRDQEMLQPLAYSIDCYLNEKIKYINKFNLTVSNDDYRNMFHLLKIMIEKSGSNSERTHYVVTQFGRLIKDRNKLNILTFKQEDKDLYYALVNY